MKPTYRRWWLLLALLAGLACSVVTRVTPTAAPTAAATAAATGTARPAATGTALSASATPSAAAPTRTPRPTATAAPATAAPATAVLPTSTAEFTSTLTPAQVRRNVAVFESVWQDVHDNYVYPDFNGLDWPAVRTDYLARVQAAATQEEFYGLMRQLIDSLGDNHSRFLSPDEVKEEDLVTAGQGDYVGIGIVRELNETKRTAVILMVLPDSPAERAGVQAHDSILSVNGKPVIDAQGVEHVSEIRGPEGTPVTLTVQSVGGEPREMVIVRARVSRQYPVVAKRLPGDIAYLMIPAFDDETIGDRLIAAFEQLTAQNNAPLKGVVLDVRLNYGGYLSEAVKVMGLFTGGTVGYLVDHGRRQAVTVRAQDVGGSQQMPLVVLAGPSSESMGEVTPGILQDLGRAKIVGMPTAGNVEVLLSYDYDDGSRMWLAEETFQPVNHPEVKWEGHGVQPDVKVEAQWDEFTDADDPQLKAALDLLSK